MYTVAELLREKGSSVLTIAPGATVLDAARTMNQYRVGCLVVAEGPVDATGQATAVTGLDGIITERDLLTRVLAKEREPARTLVSEVMSKRVITCKPNTPLEEVRKVMRDEHIRHMPVLDGGWVVGVLSIGDLNMAESVTLSHTIETLEAYITRG